MRFLHTADWHLGQTFYEYDRTDEHLAFFEWLKNTIKKEQIDVLLVAGDIFDTANPSAQTTRLFYDFLYHISQKHPDLHAFFIAGNHDSSIRLETPTPLLAGTNIHLVGQIRKTAQQQIMYEQLIYPIKKDNKILAYCLAVPFLRLGDYPKSQNSSYDYVEGVTEFYREITTKASEIANGKPIISMGHLHASGTDYSINDTADRAIMGGMEGINIKNVSKEAHYWALGHIHKPQPIAGLTHARYSGSPIPLSFAEIDYPHQVVVFDITENQVNNIRAIHIPVSVPLLNIPKNGYESLEYVLGKIEQLPNKDSVEYHNFPYLQVKVSMQKPHPEMKPQILQSLSNKAVRLARIDAKLISSQSESINKSNQLIDLQNINPKEVLEKSFEKKYNEPLPESYIDMLEEVLEQINHKKNML